jgi:predicted lipoprotein with Yx(FWY)xxD motif
MRKLAVAAVLVALVVVPASLAASQGKVQAKMTSAGNVLTDARGHALYLYAADKSRASTCYGVCAKQWPPFLTTAKPLAGSGVKSTLLGTTKRKDGKLQVTFMGHPLYFFAKDLKPGQLNGLTDSAGIWSLVTPAGKKISKPTVAPNPGYPTSTTGDMGSSGGDYGYGGGGY